MEIKDFINVIAENEMKKELLKLVKDFNKLEPEEFYNKYNDELELEDCFDEDEFIEAIEDEEDILGTLIIFYLVGNDVLLQIDWKGEYDDGSTIEFVNEQLEELYDEEFTVDEEKIKYDYENDDVTLLFKEVNKQLNDMGYYLVNFDDDSDQYYVGVYKVQAVKKIENQKVEGLKVQIYRYEDSEDKKVWRTFTYKDDKSNKFWRIKYVSGESKYIINYGKTDTIGRFEEKEFDSSDICEKEAEKIIRQKLKKGYVENKSV